MQKVTVQYGKTTISARLLFRPRKTLGISVLPDCSVEVVAPASATIEQVKSALLRRARWIKKQQTYFSQFLPRTPERSYVPGETHLYLGKRYRLRSSEEIDGKIKLRGGYFLIPSGYDEPQRVKKLLVSWYRARAREQFTKRLQQIVSKFTDLETPKLVIKSLKARWGSMSPSGVLTLNLALVRAPIECIDYVITHELCHLRHMHHGPEFWRELSRAMPRWPQVKQRLEIMMR